MKKWILVIEYLKSLQSGVIKIFLILLPSVMLSMKYLDEKYSDCSKNCILPASGSFIAAYILFSFGLFFWNSFRQKSMDMLKIYIPAVFLLFSGIHYLDFRERDLDLNAKKDFITYHFQTLDLQDKNVSNKEII